MKIVNQIVEINGLPFCRFHILFHLDHESGKIGVKKLKQDKHFYLQTRKNHIINGIEIFIE